MAFADAVRATRSTLKNANAARAWAAESAEGHVLHGKRLAYFNGAFSPPTRAHAHIVAALCADPRVDALWLDPEPARPNKPQWLDEIQDARVEMCECMLADLGLAEVAGVGTLRRDLGPDLGGTTELFLSLRELLGGPGEGRLLWAVGADVLEGMRFWSERARACLQPGQTCDGLVVFAREGWTEERIHAAAEAVLGCESVPCELSIVRMPDDLFGESSHKARRALTLAAKGIQRLEDTELSSCLLPAVRDFCLSRLDVLAVYDDQVINTPDNTPVIQCETHEPHLQGMARLEESGDGESEATQSTGEVENGT